MKIIDVHSHWGGYPLQTDQELAQQRATWNSQTRYHTEAEMAAYFRAEEDQIRTRYLTVRTGPVDDT